MNAQERFDEKLPALERKLRFMVYKRGIPKSKHDDIFQIARMDLWKRCLKNSDTIINCKFIAKTAIREMTRYKVDNEKITTLFSSLEDPEFGKNKFSRDIDEFQIPIEHDISIFLDDTTLTVRDIAIDFLEQYANEQKDRKEVADSLGTSPEHVKFLRCKLGKPVMNYRWCHDSIEQIRSQIETPESYRAVRFKKEKNVKILACADCGKEREFHQSQLKTFSNEIYRCKKCCFKHVKRPRCTIHNLYHGPAGCPKCKS